MSVFPPEPGNDFFAKLAALWKSDGLTLLTRNWQPDLIQLAFAVTPDVAPTFFTHRVKGRLQHALREAGTPVDFSRKASMRAIGENITDVVENYLAHQTARGDFADNRYRDMLQAESFEEDALDLADPVEVKRGRYWYNLHLVLVTADRFRMGKEDFALKLRAATQSAAADNGCRVKAFALMPDHVHIAMRGNVERSPVELGVAFQNALTKVAGCRLWDYRFYVGTFSEYGIKKILR
jgi:REP element-mobilizing transposase RayT